MTPRLLLADSHLTLLTHRFAESWPWYMIRASGFAAAGLLILLMVSGIGQVTGLTYRYLEPIKAWAAHKTLAYALLVSIFIHALFLLVDRFLPFSLPQILIPFADTYSNNVPLFGFPLGFLGVAAGIFAGYGIVTIVATSLGLIDRNRYRWRQLHYLSYVVAGLVFTHALLVGTDVRYGSFRAVWLALGGLVLLAVIARLWRARTLAKPQ